MLDAPSAGRRGRSPKQLKIRDLHSASTYRRNWRQLQLGQREIYSTPKFPVTRCSSTSAKATACGAEPASGSGTAQAGGFERFGRYPDNWSTRTEERHVGKEGVSTGKP